MKELVGRDIETDSRVWARRVRCRSQSVSYDVQNDSELVALERLETA